MIAKTHDAALVNRIANSAGVREFVDYRGVDEPMDFTPAMGRAGITGMVWLTDGMDALACFVMTGAREYQAHLFFGAACRGRKAIETGREMMAWITRFADRLWGLIPLANTKARWFARRMGFRADGFDEAPVGVPVERLVWGDY